MKPYQAKLLAMTGAGEKIKHQKGSVYTVIGFCMVQINGEWKDAIQYTDSNRVYVRATDDCEKISISKD